MPGYKWSDILTLCLQDRLQAARNIVNKTIPFFDAKYLVVGRFFPGTCVGRKVGLPKVKTFACLWAIFLRVRIERMMRSVKNGFEAFD